MCEEKSNGGTTTTRHTLVDWLLRVPLWHGGGCAAVGWFGRRRRHRCVRVWFFLSGLLKISVRFGEPEWNYCKIHSTQHENFEASLSLPPSVPLPSSPPPPWVFGFINTLRRSQSVPDISAKAEASSFLWVKNSMVRIE